MVLRAAAAGLRGLAAAARLIVALLLAWGGGNALLDLRRLQRDRGAGQRHHRRPRTDRPRRRRRCATRLTTALDLLKKSLGSRGYLYEQPWYAIIGPPGAGKTTALLNAGLRFPLAEQMGQGAIAGIGGTRLCDWWFTEDAVLIDTAGRYTTQDSNAAVDRAGWDAFLDLLKETRPRQPLNGLLVAFPLSDSPRRRRPSAKRTQRRSATGSRNCRPGSACGCRSMCCSPRPI